MLLWLDRYHLEPTPDRLPDAVRNMVRLGLLRDPEKSGMFVGFMAGVLGDNPRQAEVLFRMPKDRARRLEGVSL